MKNSLGSSMNSAKLKESDWLTCVPLAYVSLTELLFVSIQTHFCFKWPMNSCNPIRAKTLRQNTVRIITSASFFTDWNRAPTMVFRPASHMISHHSLSSLRKPFNTESQCQRHMCWCLNEDSKVTATPHLWLSKMFMFESHYLFIS